MVRRFATVRWHLPSAVSGAGETVAALAAHIAEADMAFAASAGSACSIVVPSSDSQGRSGRGCGTNRPWVSPSAMLARILSSPCSAAARGSDTCKALRVEARLPKLRPGIIVARPDDPVEVDLDQRHSARHHRHRVADIHFEQLGRLRVDASRLFWRASSPMRSRRGSLSAARSRPASSNYRPHRSRPRFRCAPRAPYGFGRSRRHGRSAVEDVDVAVEHEALMLEHAHRRPARRVRLADDRLAPASFNSEM